MTRIVVIGGGVAGIAAQLDALCLARIATVREFRELILAMGAIDVPAPYPPEPLPLKFGGNRPYLKKKKGRP